jgi:DNA-binding PadR family transcriptional regulator
MSTWTNQNLALIQPLFEKGTLKYVILDLLKDQPSHGYQIIQALQSRLAGSYKASAGSVYPALRLLENSGYVTSTKRDAKKTYTVTEAGRKFLHENEEYIDRIKGRMRERTEAGRKEEWPVIINRLGQLYVQILQQAHSMGPEKLARIKTITEQTLNDIQNVLKE